MAKTTQKKNLRYKTTKRTAKRTRVAEQQVSYQNNSIPELINIKQAAEWATNHLEKNVTPSNISYLIQYGRVKKYGDNGSTQISLKELEKYYESFNGRRETSWKNQLGSDLNWALSFDQYKEAETTNMFIDCIPIKGNLFRSL